jgi:hypothetical protein
MRIGIWILLILAVFFGLKKKERLKKHHLLVPARILRLGHGGKGGGYYAIFEVEVNGKRYESKALMYLDPYKELSNGYPDNLYAIVTPNGEDRDLIIEEDDFKDYNISYMDTVGKNVYYFPK